MGRVGFTCGEPLMSRVGFLKKGHVQIARECPGVTRGVRVSKGVFG